MMVGEGRWGITSSLHTLVDHGVDRARKTAQEFEIRVSLSSLVSLASILYSIVPRLVVVGLA